MHQTFYIDIDEEITSIVEKLRKTKAPEAIMVVPKRSLLIQSIVNLKLLRKEADNLGVKISIITQDKLGKLLVGKAGISLQQKIDDDFEEMEIASSESDNKRKDGGSAMFNTNTQEVNQNKRRLDRIGSSEYFSGSNEDVSNINDEVENFEKNKPIAVKNIPVYSSKIERSDFNPLSDINIDNEIVERKKTVSSSMDVARPSRPKIQKTITKTSPTPIEKDNQYFQEHSLQQNAENKDKQLEHFFYANSFSGRKDEDLEDIENNEKGFGFFAKAMTFFLIVGLFGGSVYAAFVYIPKAKITIFAKKEIKSSTINMTVDIAQSNIDYEKKLIPAKMLDFNETVSETFETTELKNVSEQKAKGKITIYNEFSSASQPLVATTRFLSEDQKIFRLVQNVTVPGTTKVGDETKPGVVEVEVIADEAGDSYNIGPANFSIPGFKDSGNEKYKKIYAKSTQAMTGGGKGNNTVKVISEKDISAAKDKLSLKITDTIKKKIKDSAESGTVILDNAISLEEPIYEVSGSAGEIANTFEIKVQSKAKAIVFLESDVKTLANSIVSKSGNGKVNIDSSALVVDYGKVNTDFKLGTLNVEVLASNIIQPSFDLEDLRQGFLGKNNDELATYLRNYSEIEKAEVEYWPPVFVSKIPKNKKRVEIKLDYMTP
ncbi:MAG: hypothetical protein WA019_05730 [Candidatus Moraniibacteriota bacterium]